MVCENIRTNIEIRLTHCVPESRARCHIFEELC